MSEVGKVGPSVAQPVKQNHKVRNGALVGVGAGALLRANALRIDSNYAKEQGTTLVKYLKANGGIGQYAAMAAVGIALCAGIGALTGKIVKSVTKDKSE